ncbi:MULTISPECIES: hypothetical protein [Mycobacterium]|uniref:hypothetical protein n=1 Tax=Mycobacterium TaxID=1763 RepID=UPI001151D317|nr:MULTISPECIES: hypothetical protein [Mycobacterium]MCQ4364816.1 hypothetical protein [Mycobacterium gordonae]MCV7010278.1 hypothetical protein [Mycobacterium gordonae]
MSTRGGDFGGGRRTGGPFPAGPQTDPLPRETPAPDFTLDPRQRRRPSLTTLGVGLAIVLAVAALVMSLIALMTDPAPAPAASTAKPPVADADKALCQAIGPLMKENDDRSNAFLATGEAGSPERDAALPKFVADTQDWARRTQQALDGHNTPPRLATRALQRYVDDMQLFVASVRPGAGTQYDEAAWTDSIVAYGGVLSTCQQIGIGW